MIDLCGLRHEFSKVPPFAFTNTTQVVNGELAELKPKYGMMLLVR